MLTLLLKILIYEAVFKMDMSIYNTGALKPKF
jgi:hypothetical protein